MKFLSLFVAFLAVSSTFCAWEEEDDVIIGTEQNFKEILDKFDSALVEFYAPWCGHCKKLTPEYAKAAKTLKSSAPNIALVKVDSTVHKDLASKYEVKGYPTIKWFVKDVHSEYNGGRTDSQIVSWIQKKVGISSKAINSQAEFEAFLKQGDVQFIYFGDSDEDKELATHKQLAQSFDDVSFGHVFAPEVKESQSVQGRDFVLFKTFDEKRNDFDGEATVEQITNFINSHSIPTVMPFNDKAIETVFQKQNPTLFLFADEEAKSVEAETIFRNTAPKAKSSKVIFSISKSNDGFGHYTRLAEYVGVDVKNSPQVMLVAVGGEAVAKYKFEHEITEQNLIKFVNDFQNGKLRKFAKSEEVPEKNDEPVKVIVGKQFNDLVLNNDKDVLVEFYAPWCGHCKSLAPIYDKLAKKLASNPNIVIAKMDATANEVDSVSIKGFPTLKFYKNGSKDAPLDYEGDRDEAGFIKYLKQHTSHAWVEPSDEL